MTYGQQVVDNIQNIVGCNSALATVQSGGTELGSPVQVPGRGGSACHIQAAGH